MTASKTRAEFEAWAAESGFGVATLDRFAAYPKGTYEDSRTDAAWKGYQAARRATLEEAAQACDDLKFNAASYFEINERLDEAAASIRAIGDEEPKP
jgi:non-ribosomal peptide synthetase component E (peptide arylation enzyme)